MSELFAPPQAALAETVEPELGWSSFGHVRRLAICANAVVLALCCATAAWLASKGRMDGYAGAYLLFAGACSLGSMLSLWLKSPHKALAGATVVGNLLLALFLCGLLTMTTVQWLAALLVLKGNPAFEALAETAMLIALAIPPVSALYAQRRIRKNAALAAPPAQ